MPKRRKTTKRRKVKRKGGGWKSRLAKAAGITAGVAGIGYLGYQGKQAYDHPLTQWSMGRKRKVDYWANPTVDNR